MVDRPPSGYANADPSNTITEVEAATRRLAAALDALEAAVDRRRDSDRDEDELAARIHALGTDRSRLANELDSTLVRARELERVNRDVSQRLDHAIDTIRTVLEDGEAT